MYPAEDPAGFGPALQVVTDHGGMLMDSVTVLLHRLGVPYTAIMTPVFDVQRSPEGDLVSVEAKSAGASQYAGEAWIHVQLLPSVDSKGLTEVERLLPKVLADVQQVASDASSLIAVLNDLAGARRSQRRKTTSRRRTAMTSRRCCAGWATETSSCSAISVATCTTVGSPATGHPASASCAPAPARAPG